MRDADPAGTLWRVDDDATQLMLEALFDIRAVAYEIRDELIEPEDGDEEAEEDA